MKNGIKAFKDILKKLLYILDKKQKQGAIIVFVCMLLSSMLELLGVSIIYPFLQLMLNTEALHEKWYIKFIKNIFPDITTNTILICIGVAIMLVYVSKNIFMLFSVYIQNAYAAKFQKENSVKVLNAYLKRPYEFFLNTNSSIILRGISSDVAGVYQILLNCFTILSESFNVLALGIFLLVTDLFISICAIILAFLCFLIIMIRFKDKMKKAGNEMREATNLKYQYSYQAINGIKEITVLNRRENFVSQFKEAAELEEKVSVINGFVSACPDRILEGICIAGFMGIVCVEILLGRDLNTFIPILGTFAVGAFRILPSISKISSRLNGIIFNKPCLESTYQNLREIEEYEKRNSRKYIERDKIPSIEGKKENINFKEKLEIENISWMYANTKDFVLDSLNLTLYKGESIALIGASGAGKSTLADVIMGILKPQKGTIKLDGTDIYSIPKQWSKIVGYVPQTVFLIDDTVRNNIAFGIKKEDIDDNKIWKALEQAQLKDFVKGLENGLDTIVGEYGVKFSGGQRQRIAIARALYENPDILVLDEATSALDNDTENAVMEAIDALRGVKTLIIVAHRLTTIKNCNKIYEIKNGVAIERNKEEILG